MAITNSVGGGGTPISGTAAGQTRRVDTQNKIQEATLSGTERLSSQDIQAHQQFYNKTVSDLDGIRGGLVGGCVNLDESVLDKLFPHRKDDKKVDEATSPNIFDNKGAEGLRADYKKAYNEAKRERARAERQAEKLGPGDHQLSNGDKVNVKIDEKTGRRTVTTTRPDGTVKTVSFDPKQPNSVDVTTRNPDGSTSKLRQQGTEVTREKTDVFGRHTEERFSLDEKGNPVRETSGPGEEDYTRVTANDDGSTDTRNEIYEENGQPVYEDTHQPPGWEFPKPHPCPPKWPPIGPILPYPWWRERRPEDHWERDRIPDLVPFRATR